MLFVDLHCIDSHCWCLSLCGIVASVLMRTNERVDTIHVPGVVCTDKRNGRNRTIVKEARPFQRHWNDGLLVCITDMYTTKVRIEHTGGRDHNDVRGVVFIRGNFVPVFVSRKGYVPCCFLAAATTIHNGLHQESGVCASLCLHRSNNVVQ